MEGRFALIGEEGRITHPQEQRLRHCHFLFHDLFPYGTPPLSDEMSVEPTGIVICSPPKDSMDVEESSVREEELYQTPEEHLAILSQDQRNDPDEPKFNGVDAVGESSIAVELGRDTDLVFSFEKSLLEKDVTTEIFEDAVVSEILAGEAHEFEVTRLDLGKNEILKTNSPSKDTDMAFSHDKSVPENVVWTEIVEDVVASGNNSGDSEVLRLSLGKNEILQGNSTPINDLGFPDVERPGDAQVEEAGMDGASEKRVIREVSKLDNPFHRIRLILDKIKSERANAEASQAQRNLPDRVDHNGDVLGRRETQRGGIRGDGSSSRGEDIGGEAERLDAGNELSEASCGEIVVQPFVTLMDLVDDDDDDILAVAIKAGVKFPRPRWWRPEGYGRNSY